MPHPVTPVTILVIEDDVPVRNLFCRWLREWAGVSMRCVEVDTLAQGVEALRAGAIDLIILDYRVPGAESTSGILALQDVMPAGQAPIPIDVVSGRITREEGTEVIRAGADDYLQKDPVTLRNDLLDMVQRSWARYTVYRRLTEQVHRGHA